MASSFFRQQTDVATFVNQLIAGNALPTGSESPFKLKDTIAERLKNPNGSECRLISISNTVSGGHWQGDNGNKGYIGNFQCKIENGNETTFANLDVTTVVAMRMNQDKAVLTLSETTNPKDSNKPYKNVRLFKGMVLDLKDAKVIETLKGIVQFVEQTAPVAAP